MSQTRVGERPSPGHRVLLRRLRLRLYRSLLEHHGGGGNDEWRVARYSLTMAVPNRVALAAAAIARASERNKLLSIVTPRVTAAHHPASASVTRRVLTQRALRNEADLSSPRAQELSVLKPSWQDKSTISSADLGGIDGGTPLDPHTPSVRPARREMSHAHAL